jgi:hypothetical protein
MKDCVAIYPADTTSDHAYVSFRSFGHPYPVVPVPFEQLFSVPLNWAKEVWV